MSKRPYIAWIATFAHNLSKRGALFAVVFAFETLPQTVPKWRKKRNS